MNVKGGRERERGDGGAERRGGAREILFFARVGRFFFFFFFVPWTAAAGGRPWRARVLRERRVARLGGRARSPLFFISRSFAPPLFFCQLTAHTMASASAALGRAPLAACTPTRRAAPARAPRVAVVAQVRETERVASASSALFFLSGRVERPVSPVHWRFSGRAAGVLWCLTCVRLGMDGGRKATRPSGRAGRRKTGAGVPPPRSCDVALNSRVLPFFSLSFPNPAGRPLPPALCPRVDQSPGRGALVLETLCVCGRERERSEGHAAARTATRPRLELPDPAAEDPTRPARRRARAPYPLFFTLPLTSLILPLSSRPGHRQGADADLHARLHAAAGRGRPQRVRKSGEREGETERQGSSPHLDPAPLPLSPSLPRLVSLFALSRRPFSPPPPPSSPLPPPQHPRPV